MILTKDFLNKIEIIPDLDSLKLEKLEDAIYFSTQYNDYISNSRLNLIDPKKDGTPEKFFEGLNKHKQYGSSLDLGNAVHTQCLQEDRFSLVYGLGKPTAKAGQCAEVYYPCFLEDDSKENYYNHVKEVTEQVGYYVNLLSEKKIEDLYNKCINYWNNRREFDKDYVDIRTPIYLDDKTGETATLCIDAISKNSEMQELLHPSCVSENEQAILLDINVLFSEEATPIKLHLKAKLDNYSINQESNTIVVNDIKTIGKILTEFPNNCLKYSYYRELSFYSWLLSLVAKKYYNMNSPIIKSNFLVVSTIPDYYTQVVPMSKANFINGWREFNYLLKLVACYYNEGFRFS